MTDITKLAEQAADQVISETSAKKKKKRISPAWLLAPAGLGAAAGLGGAYTLASDSHAANLSKAIENSKTPLGPDETPLTRYTQTMSQLANSTPGGVPIGEILAKARSSADLMKRVGIGEAYAATTPGAFQEARMHYDAFRKGPIAALHHMMQPEARGNTAIPQELVPDRLKGKVNNYGEALNPHFRDAWKKFVAKKLPGAAGWISPLEIDTKVIPYKDQLEFFKEYENSIPADLKALRKNVEGGMGEGLATNTRNYMPIAESALKGRRLLKNLGITSAGAGAGGLLGHYLHGALADQENPSTLGYLASTLGGAGLGGAASYFGGTEQGRQQASNLIGKLMSMMQKKSAAGDKIESSSSTSPEAKNYLPKPGEQTYYANEDTGYKTMPTPGSPEDLKMKQQALGPVGAGAPAPAAPPAAPAPQATQPAPAPAPAPQQGNWLSNLPTSQALVPLGGMALGGLVGNMMGGGDEDEEPSTLRRLLYTLGGVGLGGAAGYFGGTSQGRETMSNAYNSLFGKKQAAANKLNGLLSKKAAEKCDCCKKTPCQCPPDCSCGCKQKMAASKPGLWANIHAKKQRGEAPAKPGDKDYPDAKNWKKVTEESEKKALFGFGAKKPKGMTVEEASKLVDPMLMARAAMLNELFEASQDQTGKAVRKKFKNPQFRSMFFEGMTPEMYDAVSVPAEKKAAPAWQTAEGKSESGGLNDKGRASLKAQGHDIKRPQPEGGPRKDSFCARMKGMKSKLTSEETANDPDSRINKALRKWKCGSANEKMAALAELAANTLGKAIEGPRKEKGSGIKIQIGSAAPIANFFR